MATFIVTTTDDFGTGSLREAILETELSPGDDIITFDPTLSAGSINLFNQIDIFGVNESITIDFDIDGDGFGDVELFSTQNNAVFFTLFGPGTELTLNNGNITVDVDETQTADTATFSDLISVQAVGVTINNNSNITMSSGLDTDFSAVVNAFASEDFTFVNGAGASIITTGREAIDATFSIGTNIVNDGTLIAGDDTIRIGSGTVTNSSLIQTDGTFVIFDEPGFAADGIAVISDDEALTESDFPVPEGPVFIENLETGIINGFRSGIQIFGGGQVDNDGFIFAETAAVLTGANGALGSRGFVLNNTGTLQNNGAVFGLNTDEVGTVLNLGGLESFIVNNSGIIDSANIGILSFDAAVVNNTSGGQILSGNDGTGDDEVAFYGVRLEDFAVVATLRTIDPFFGFVSSQGIFLDTLSGNLLLPDETILAPNPGQIETAFIAGVADIFPLIDIEATLMAGELVLQTDANGVLFPPTIDVESPTLGTLTVTFVSGSGFTVTDANGDPAFDIPEGFEGDVITNSQGALIDGDIITGLGDDVVDNNGQIIGDIFLGVGDDLFDGAGSIGGNTIYGEDGNDILRAGNGADILNGGAGDDELLGRSGLDILNGGDGDDDLNGGAGGDTLNGDLGADTLIGGGGADTLNGGGDNDSLIGGAGADILMGQGGDDTLSGGANGDVLSGDAGNDTLIGGGGGDTLNGGAGDDIINGGLGVDAVNGGAGADTINGGNGGDSLVGAAGADVIRGGNGNDTISGNNDDDMLFGDGGVDVLNGGAGNDLLDGGGNSDTLVGAAGADVLLGQGGSDVLSGGADNDILNGGGGNDILNGGAGADQFVFDIASGTDVIQDFVDGIDSIDLTGNSLADDFADIVAAASQDGGDVRIELNANNVLILENFDLADLDASDFIL